MHVQIATTNQTGVQALSHTHTINRRFKTKGTASLMWEQDVTPLNPSHTMKYSAKTSYGFLIDLVPLFGTEGK